MWDPIIGPSHTPERSVVLKDLQDLYYKELSLFRFVEEVDRLRPRLSPTLPEDSALLIKDVHLSLVDVYFCLFKPVC